jgi:hypothetical protein
MHLKKMEKIILIKDNFNSNNKIQRSIYGKGEIKKILMG